MLYIFKYFYLFLKIEKIFTYNLILNNLCIMDHYNYVEDDQSNNIAVSIGIPVALVKPSYNKFLSNVLFIIGIQFIVTSYIAFIGYYYRDFFLKNKEIYSNILLYDSIIFLIISLIIICCRFKKTILLYSLFILFTLSSAILLTLAILPFSRTFILLAALGTTISIFACIICSLIGDICKIEFKPFHGIIITIICITLPLILFEGFFLQDNNISQFLFALIFVIVFNIYLMFDIHNLYNHTNQLMFESAIYPAIYIYLDIINIFLYLLECINIQ